MICLWCKKEYTNKRQHIKCRKRYENFRCAFSAEMLELKNKPKAADTKIFRKVLDYLNGARVKTVMSNF